MSENIENHNFYCNNIKGNTAIANPNMQDNEQAFYFNQNVL